MRTIATFTLSSLLVLGASLSGQTTPPRPAAPAAGARYVAIGCISRQGTASAPRYVVTDARGDKPVVWRLQGEGAQLARHVGHTVEISGSIAAGSPLTMSVRSVVWIASSCKK